MITYFGNLYQLIDVWTLLHIFVAFLIGMAVFGTFKKSKHLLIFCLFIAIMWEIIENTVVYDFSPLGDGSIINILGDIFIGDFLGFLLAYSRTGKRFK